MECDHVIRFFDSTMERRLYYSDFLQLVLPCDQNVLRADASQRQTYEVSPEQYLPFDIEKLLSKLLFKELKYAKDLENLKQQLACHPDYNLQRQFWEIDRGSNYIDCHNLKSFLIRCSYLPNDNLLMAIIRRMDLDGDARINYMELVDGLRPLENYMDLLEKARSKEQARIQLNSFNQR